MSAFKSIRLDIAGLGIVFYSPFAVASIVEGDDYLQKEYWNPDAVAKLAVECRIAGFCTSSSGTFLLDFFWGYPSEAVDKDYDRSLRLGVEVRDRTLCFRDLYDMNGWDPKCPPDQIIYLDDGFYHITLKSRNPPSGFLGDDQEILVYLQKLPEMPKLRYGGVPCLLW